ncbi:hypothetical protein [Rhizobium sp. LCM 4573]|uniref:hypothetical protein n=1 Tax=Rhizobium sp. LCM 4573 TaxID=1848291 RepID=UPI0008D954C4|nr:hypothetical protein [Rhizobium sp. LCM 4573]OHV84173.1 hypothetical protein LCM4573_00235 [Rhizobium sp. LCM 4573]
MSIFGVQGPSLGSVIAFTMGEHPDLVARVERSAAARMANVRGWYGWRVKSVSINEAEDNLACLTVEAEPVGPGHRDGNLTIVFLTDREGRRRSDRLDAFLRACGVAERVDDTREIVGRYFAARIGARTAGDFGPLTLALVAQ